MPKARRYPVELLERASHLEPSLTQSGLWLSLCHLSPARAHQSR
jgi:hypothetical protein